MGQLKNKKSGADCDLKPRGVETENGVTNDCMDRYLLLQYLHSPHP